MNLNGDDERIRRLFREMSRDDDRLTPRFARVLETARRRTARSKDRWLVWAGAVATLCAAALIVALVAARNPKAPVVSDDQTAIAPVQPDSVAAVTPPQSTPAPKARPKRIRHRRDSSEPEIAKQLFAWQSPTATLLKVPDEEVLKSLPRLGESFQTMKLILPDDLLN